MHYSAHKIISGSTFRRNVYNMVPQGAARILDIGCGNGALLLRLKRDKGCTELYGVEMNPAETQAAAPELDGLWHVDIERDDAVFREKQGFFDYILMHDVAEHLYDPWFTLQKIRSLGSENCVFIIATPNLHHWRLQHEIMSGKFPYGHGLWHSGHLRWYTPASLVELLIIAGLRLDGLFLEIPDQVPQESLTPAGEVRRVEFPPREFQAAFDPERIYAVEYPKSVASYMPVFYAHKMIAYCTRGPLLMDPQPMTYNCPALDSLRKALDLPFDIYTPPPMHALTGPWC